MVAYHNYYPIGMLQPGRSWTSDETYRFGFNGMERDDEVEGEGNSYTATFWQYSTRLARRWNVDPVFKENISSFAAFGNNPILFVDPNGDDWYRINGELVWKNQSESYTDANGMVYQSLGKKQSLYTEFARRNTETGNV